MTTVFTMTHKKFAKPDDKIYVPLHVGRAGSVDLGYLGDDTGDNISSLNCYYGELTGLYWIWKNYEGKENIGICHYRRFFIDEKWQILTEADYEGILSKYDIVTSKAMYAKGNYWDYYARSQNRADLEEEGKVIQELYPEDYPVFCHVMDGNKHYFGNLMVAPRDTYDAYCQWLFPILFELQKRIDVSGYDDYHKRVFGFLSEQLLLVWITARGLRAYECPVGISEEKAETREFKLAMGQLIKMGRITEARQMFYEILKVRPDIELKHSDLSQEIPVIEQILHICELEEHHKLRGMLSYRQELPELIAHYHNVEDVLSRYEEWGEDEIQFLKDTCVTELAVEVITEAAKDLQERKAQILERYRRI
ncbi:MAG: DUF4422 domain-containing protein [Lachnospiraceae bacterium]|nr:DUF4422 domain-containing protein [Lachnospiraceae bacterium]